MPFQCACILKTISNINVIVYYLSKADMLQSNELPKGILKCLNCVFHGPFSDWKKLLTGVPQSFSLIPVLFNIYLNDSFYAVKNADVCNFSDVIW